MKLQEALAKLPQDGTQVGGFGTYQDEDTYAALDKAADAGFVRKDRSRAKYGETWWSITAKGRTFLAQFQ
jgi:hypothetical protein